jgi:hypothetical protein
VHGVGEVAGEIGSLLVDAPNREPYASGDGLAGSFGGVTGTPGAPAEAERSCEFRSDEVTLGSGLLGTAKVGELLGVGHVVVELSETAPILGPCPGVEHVTQIAGPTQLVWRRAGPTSSEVEHMKLVTWRRDESRQIL